MKTVLVAIALVLGTSAYYAQSPVAHYTNSTTSTTVLTGVTSDGTGGKIYCGTIGPRSLRSCMLFRVNALGQIVWQYSFPYTVAFLPEKLLTDSTGIYVVGAAYDSVTNAYPGFAAHFSINGTLLWRNRYNFDKLVDVAASPDGKYVAVSAKSIQKFDSTGVVSWSRYDISGTINQTYTGVTVDKIGNIYALGSAFGTSITTTSIVMKSDAQGSTLWWQSYTNSNYASGWSDAIATDTSLIVYGWCAVPTFPGSYKILRIAHLDTSGNVLQSKVTDFDPNASFTICDAELSVQNSIVFGGTRDLVPMIATFDAATFDFSWGVCMPAGVNHTVYDILPEATGMVHYAGGLSAFSTAADPFFFGQIADTAQHGCGWHPFPCATSIQNISPGNFSLDTIIVLTSTSLMGPSSVIALDIYTCMSLTAVPEPVIAAVNVFPNPSTTTCFVQLDRNASANLAVIVYNLTGEIVVRETIFAGTSGTQLNLEGLCAGLYFVKADGMPATPIEVLND